MIRFVIKRILWLIPVIIAVSFIIFMLMELAPGSIVDALEGDGVTEEMKAELRAKYNLDKSMFYRYGLYMFNLIQGDLGVSHITNTSVWNTYIARLPNTIVLAFSGVIIGSIIAVPMGVRASRHAGTITDNLTTTFTLIGMSMPGFWVGLLLLLLFSFQLGWFPGGDNTQGLRSLFLPALCSGLLMMANITRQTRSSMLEVLRADFLRTARAKGVPERDVIRRHALGNAWIPVITQIGISLGVQLAGAVVIEQVFTWPGVGRLLIEAVTNRDVPTAMGSAIMTSIIYVSVQLVVDLFYAFVDPRIKSRYSTAGKKRRAAKILARRAAKQPNESGAAPLAGQQSAASTLRSGEAQVNPAASIITAAQINGGHPELSDISARASISEIQAEEQAQEPVRSSATRDDAWLRSEMESRKKENLSDNDVKSIIKKYKKRSQLGEIFHRIRKNKGAVAGLCILGAMVVLLLVSTTISWESVTARNAALRLTGPTWQNPFGTDHMGRNAFLRVIYGARYSLLIGLGSISIAAIIGTTLGTLAGYYGKLTENLIMRFADILSSIPGILLGMVIMVVLRQNVRNLVFTVSIAYTQAFIRQSRAAVLVAKNNEYIEAARAIGFSNLRIAFAQALPNALSPIIVSFSAYMGLAIILGSSLSFLGFGVPAPTPEWGALVSTGRNYIRTAPWLTTFPGLFIMASVLAFNLLGDGLRDALDPKLKI